MIAFVQPFGLHSAGGGPRILRALLQDAPHPFLSVCTSPLAPPPTDIGPETHLSLRPHFGRIERTRFGRYMNLTAPLFSGRFQRRLEQLCHEKEVTGIHAIPHGLDFWHAFEAAKQSGLPYYLNVHDDMTYNLAGRPDLPEAMRRLAQVWDQADGRIVISEAMGQEYCRRYGKQSYSIVTDGLENIPASPRQRSAQSLRVYFMGAIHLSYEANFRCLQQALDRLHTACPEWGVSLTCRGGPPPKEETGFPLRTLPWASEIEVAKDLEEADLLYLPLPFDRKHESFYKFSLSTKMITYLGSGLPILYHGPADAAAGQLLEKHHAAFLVHDLNPACLAQKIQEDRGHEAVLVDSALDLARSRFLLCEQRKQFWSALGF